jgi:copper chaperone
VKLIVEGMTCGHCVKAVTSAIQKLDGNARVVVDLPARSVRIDGAVTPQQATQAIQDCGYNVTGSAEET